MKNYGLDWSRQIAEEDPVKDWVFGSASPVCIAEIPTADRERCLPKGEVQQGAEDQMDCASRGPVNIVESKFNWLIRNHKIKPEAVTFLEKYGFFNLDGEVEISDAWVAIKSGTTRQGNSMKAPIDAIRTCGILPKKLLPLEPWMRWEDYHNPCRITGEMEKIAKKSLEYFNFNYEKVLENKIEEMLDRDILNLAGFAWPEPFGGEYPRVEEEPNHVFMGLKNPRTYIFDNYIDSVDQDFIKKLAADYDFMDYAYRIIISENTNKKRSFWENLLETIKKFFSEL